MVIAIDLKSINKAKKTIVKMWKRWYDVLENFLVGGCLDDC